MPIFWFVKKLKNKIKILFMILTENLTFFFNKNYLFYKMSNIKNWKKINTKCKFMIEVYVYLI